MPRPREPPSARFAFSYPETPHVRRPGPRGYVDDEHYKPWLRDEFTFRCVYCRCRGVWFPDGGRHFSVEHVRPTSLAPVGLTDYNTLIYGCCQCNAARGASLLPLDPCDSLGKHLRVADDGTVCALTPAAEELIRIGRLNRPHLTAYRRLMLDLLVLLVRKGGSEASDLRRRLLSYPA
jgi:hypothetical protein